MIEKYVISLGCDNFIEGFETEENRKEFILDYIRNESFDGELLISLDIEDGCVIATRNINKSVYYDEVSDEFKEITDKLNLSGLIKKGVLTEENYDKLYNDNLYEFYRDV